MKIKLYPIAAFTFAMMTVVSCASTKQTKKGAAAAASEKSEKPKGGLKPYDKVITKDAITDAGLFTVHKVDDDYFYEIADSLFNREMLIVSRIAKTASGIGFGGGKANTEVLRWEKKDKKVLVRVVSHQIFAADSLPIHEAVTNSNFEPVLFSFDIKAISKDSTRTVIQVNDLYNTDVQALGMPGYYREQFKVSNVDKDRSYIESLKSYPLNIEARHVKTYNAKNAPSNGSLGSITVEMNNSMVLLPKVPMERRC